MRCIQPIGICGRSYSSSSLRRLSFLLCGIRITNNIGLKIRQDKSVILTSTNRISPLPNVSPIKRKILQEYINKYVFDKATQERKK